MRLLWDELKTAVPLIFHGNPYLGSTIWFTVQVAFISTAIATVVGLPLAVLIGLGRFRGRALLQWIANACLALPPVLVGLFLFMLFIPQGPLGDSRLERYTQVGLHRADDPRDPVHRRPERGRDPGLPPGLLVQARALGAGRRQLAVLALREARIGVIAAIIAALASTLSEVAAIIVVGGNIYGYDQTLASAALYEANAAQLRRRGRLRDRADRADARPARRHLAAPAALPGRPLFRFRAPAMT